jgi:hypothetical protein
LAIVGTGYRASQGYRSERWTLIVVCAIAAVFIVADANDTDLRTLYPVGANGTLDTSQPGVLASLGIAIYVAGAGVAAAFVGALSFFQKQDARSARVMNVIERRQCDKPGPGR